MSNYSFKILEQGKFGLNRSSPACNVLNYNSSSLASFSKLSVLSPWPPSHCFCPSGKAKTLHLQASKNTVSSSSYSPKPENSTSKKSTSPVLNITTSTTSLCPAPPPATPLALVVRPRRPHQEVLKPVVLVLPPIHFPNFFPPQHARTRFSPSPSYNYNKWRTPAPTVPLSRSSGSLSKDVMVKSRPPAFWAHKRQHKYKRSINFCARCLPK